MRYRTPRQSMDEETQRIVSREIRRQKIGVLKATRKNLKELSYICESIKNHGMPEYLVCKKLPKGLGYGIFLHPKAKPISKGQIIGPYSGAVSIIGQNDPGDSAYAFSPIYDIHLNKKEQAHFDPKRPFHPRRLYALDVDAIKDGNFIRFINHSDKPNIVAHLYRIPKNASGLSPCPAEVIYVAKKTIRPGEQLLVSYEGDGKSYWNQLHIKPAPIYPRTYTISESGRLVRRNFN